MTLIIVDLQKGFLTSAEPEHLAERLACLLRKGIFHAVLATQFVSVPQNPFQRFMGWDGLHGVEQDISDIVLPMITAVIPKSGFSCVNDTLLQKLKEVHGGELPVQVFLAGTDTEACVFASAIHFFELGVRPVVLADYCASSGGMAVHKAGLLCIERAIGAMNVMRGTPTSEQISPQASGHCRHT